MVVLVGIPARQSPHIVIIHNFLLVSVWNLLLNSYVEVGYRLEDGEKTFKDTKRKAQRDIGKG